MTRKAFGDAVTLYADANGSYDVPMAIDTSMWGDQATTLGGEPLHLIYGSACARPYVGRI